MYSLQNILHGASTVLEILPRTPKVRHRYVPPSSDSAAIAQDFQAVGSSITKVLRGWPIDEKKER